MLQKENGPSAAKSGPDAVKVAPVPQEVAESCSYLVLQKVVLVLQNPSCAASNLDAKTGPSAAIVLLKFI